jgi:hypothetical protein
MKSDRQLRIDDGRRDENPANDAVLDGEIAVQDKNGVPMNVRAPRWPSTSPAGR